MSTATNGAATEAAFQAIVSATKDAGHAAAAAATPVGPSAQLASGTAAANSTNAAHGLLNK